MKFYIIYRAQMSVYVVVRREGIEIRGKMCGEGVYPVYLQS